MADRAAATWKEAPLVRPGSASVSREGVGGFLKRCLETWKELSVVEGTSESLTRILGGVAEAYFSFFQENGRSFECMRDVDAALPLHRLNPSLIRTWFGDIKGFPEIDQLVHIAEHGAPVHVDGVGDIGAALAYSNHSSVGAHVDRIVAKIAEDVKFGHAFVFPIRAAASIPGLRLSPLGVVVSTSKVRVIHDLTFSSFPSGPGVNSDTDFDTAPPCKLGHVLRDVIWRILYLRRKFGTDARIVLSKMDVANAFRQVPVEFGRSPTFSYVFGNMVVVDRRLQFGWRNSPGFWCLFASALEHAHVNTTFRDAVVTVQGRAAAAHVVVQPAGEAERSSPLPPNCRVPPGTGGGVEDPFFVRFYVDDAILVEVQLLLGGIRCLRASESLSSDHFRLFGDRRVTDLPLLAARKVTSWDTRLEVLGWEIDTVGMTISLPPAKLARLRALLRQWPDDRAFASESELRTLTGKLLHVCEVVRPGKFFVRRMLNQLGLSSGSPWKDNLEMRRARKRKPLKLTPEFHSDVAFWRLLVEGVLQHRGGTLHAPLYSFFLQPPSRTLWSDASGDAMGGYCLESGTWWRMDFDEGVRTRLRQKVRGRDDLSINVLELLGMVVTAWAFVGQTGAEPMYQRESILMRGDNQSAIHWINQCRGGREPRSGALMRILGCLEVRSGWCFRARHVKGVNNVLADGISRWDRASIPSALRSCRPDIAWQEQDLGQAGTSLCSGILASSSSGGQLRDRLNALTTQVFGLGQNFEG